MSADRRNKDKQDQEWQEEEQAPFRWEYAHESLTEVGSVFRRNPPEYERDSYSWRQ